MLRQSLQEQSVNIDRVMSTSSTVSGIALIGVADDGANTITIIAGANGCLTPADVEANSNLIGTADALIVQLETPLPTVLHAVKLARHRGILTILDPAPAPDKHSSPWIEELFPSVDVVSPNQSEAELLTGVAVTDIDSARSAAKLIKQMGTRHVVMKLGELGALVCQADQSMEVISAPKVKVVDTTAAGDAFTAALTVALVEGKGFIDATRFACAAGSLACTRFGAQPAMPSRFEVDREMKLEQSDDR